MDRDLYTSDHEDFRRVVAEFIAREVTPNIMRWEAEKIIDRDAWLAAGRHGIIGLSAPEALGGGGGADYRFRSVVLEELAKAYATSLSFNFSLQDDIAIPYISEIGTAEQKSRWIPSLASGQLIAAIAMTEPNAGSDLRGVRTTGQRVDGGWLVNGAKTFITNGIQSDIVITVVRTDPDGGPHGFSLLVVERGMEGFSRGRKLDKVGLHGQDTAELFFDDVFVPEVNVLGEIGGGFGQLKRMLPLERLSIAVYAVSAAEAILSDTISYTTKRVAFGQRIADFQNTRFQLAEMRTELTIARVFVDHAIMAQNIGKFTDVDAAQAKWWTTDLQNRVVDRCLQLHGGYGFMTEYPVGRAYQDARVQKIAGGSNEIMKHIIGRSLVGTGGDII
jgi:alkylation response protein AidB-like acyl-CoA dehydrogenase